ncbi:MAG TPA: serine hydrolase [Thermoanaerobaculia bacterium]|jgi:beta-lactamase class A
MISLILAAALTLPPQKTHAVFGVSAMDLDTGRTVSVRGNQRFPMASVFKFPIALSVIRHVPLDEPVTIEPQDFSLGWSPLRDAAKGQPLHMTTGELLASMLRDSDNTAGDYFIRRIGPKTITRETNVRGIRIDRTEKAIILDIRRDGVPRFHADPRDTSTPNAMVALLARFARKPDPRLMQLMLDSTTGARRLKSIVPPGATLAHKTGTMPGVLNDVGILTFPNGQRIAIAVFSTKRPENEPDEDAEDDLAAIANAAIAKLR